MTTLAKLQAGLLLLFFGGEQTRTAYEIDFRPRKG